MWSENFLGFSLRKVSWNLAWHFGEMFFSVLRFPGLGVREKIAPKCHAKNAVKNGKFHANVSLCGGVALRVFFFLSFGPRRDLCNPCQTTSLSFFPQNFTQISTLRGCGAESFSFLNFGPWRDLCNPCQTTSLSFFSLFIESPCFNLSKVFFLG